MKFLMTFIAGLLFFTATSFISKSHFDKSTKRLNTLAEQELNITKHIFVVSDIQTRIQQALEALIFDLRKFQSGGLNASDLERRLSAKAPYILKEVNRAQNQYTEMKSAVIPQLDGAYVALLGVELYEDEFKYFKSKFEKGSGILTDNTINNDSVAMAIFEFENSRMSLEKIMLSYFEEFDTVAGNAQDAVISDQRKSWSLILFSNIAFFGILCLTFIFLYYNVLIPLKNGVNIAHRIAKGERELEFDYEEDDEIGELIHSLKDMANSIYMREDKLVQDKGRAVSESMEKTELLVTLNNEVQKPLDVINSAIHKVHDDGSTNAKNKELLEIAEHESEHLAEVIHRIEDVTGVEVAPQKNLNYTEENIKSFILEYAQNHESRIRKLGMELYTSIDPSVPESVFLDINKFKEVLEYTLGATLNMSQGGEIRLLVSTSKTAHGSFLLISLSEMRTTLESIANENAATSLLQKHEFESVDLALHQKMVKQLGGELDAKSVSGHGSEFNFIIPILDTHGKEEVV